MDEVRAILKEAGTKNGLWGEAASYTAYLMNRTVTPTLKLKISYEALFGSAFNNSKLRTFGFKEYVRMVNERRNSKWDDCSQGGVYISTTKGEIHRLYGTKTRSMWSTKHVSFEEGIFDLRKI